MEESPRRKRKSRGRGLRKTTGCLICRKRHIKCDEATPSCGACARGRYDCIYAESPAAVPVEHEVVTSPSLSEDHGSSRNEEWHTSSPHIQQSHAGVLKPTAWEANLSDFDRRQAASGLANLNAAGAFPQPLNVLSPDAPTVYSQLSVAESAEAAEALNRIPPNSAFQRWFGLLAGDAAREMCGFPVVQDNTPEGSSQYPDHGRNNRLEPLSIPPTQLDLTVPNGDRQEPSFPRSPSNLGLSMTDAAGLGVESWRAAESLKLRPCEQEIFVNFVKNISKWIDLFDPVRHFSSLVPHLAINNAGLMSAVLALSARHLSLRPHANDTQFADRSIGLQHYYETLHYLQQAMHYDTYTTSPELLATALIVSTYEMLDDSGTGWERHLRGVFWIQNSQVIQGESGGLKQAVWWAWLRQDVWAAFRERRKTFSFWTPTKTYDALTPYELASRSFYLFARAVDYCSKQEISAGDAFLRARIAKADRIFNMLDEWRRSLTVDFTPLPVNNDQDDVFEPIWIHPPAFGVSVQFHHAAKILVLLNKPSAGGLHDFLSQQRLLVASVETICGIAMTLTKDAALLMSSQCLFIAGMCVQGSQKREAVAELLDSCQNQIGWPTKSLSEELRREWDKLDIR